MMRGHDQSRQYRMADLVAMAGVSKESIHFYIREGLLPPAVKTARNMGWYSEQHLELLKLIRSLQDEQMLPLKAIKAVLHDPREHDFTPRQRQLIDRIRSKRHAQIHAAVKQAGAPVSELGAKHGHTPQELDQLRQLGFLTTLDDGIPADAEAECIQLWGSLRGAGLTVARGFTPLDLDFLSTTIDLLFDLEIRLFRERLSDLADEEIEPLLGSAIPAISRILAILHEHKINSFLEHFRTPNNQLDGGK